MSKTPREFTNYLLESIDEGLISAQAVVEMCVNYMSEDDVKNMMEINELPTPYDEEDDEDEDEEEEIEDWTAVENFVIKVSLTLAKDGLKMTKLSKQLEFLDEQFTS